MTGAAHAADNFIGSTIRELSFSGLLTLVDIGSSMDNGRIGSGCGWL